MNTATRDWSAAVGRLEDGALFAYVGAWRHAEPADQTGAQIT